MLRSPPSLKGRALRLLAAREHSRAELERKLVAHETEPGQLREVLDELQAKGFLDERRAAESLLHRRAAKLGSLRLKQELQAKGVDGELVRQAITNLARTEVDRAREVWRRKFGQLPVDAAGRARQTRFLAARGFGAEAITRVLRGAAADDE